MAFLGLTIDDPLNHKHCRYEGVGEEGTRCIGCEIDCRLTFQRGEECQKKTAAGNQSVTFRVIGMKSKFGVQR